MSSHRSILLKSAYHQFTHQLVEGGWMCFSATVSFAASALLLPAGLYSLRLAQRQNPNYISIASIPIAFAIQQVCEGIVWLGLGAGSLTKTHLGALGFLAFAYWGWLFYAPWAVAQTECRQIVQQICRGMGWLGLLYGALLYVPLLQHPAWLTVHIVHQSIQYQTQLIFDPWISQQGDRLIYAIIILIPLMLASNPALKLLGAAICLSALISHWLLNHVFISLWCFFAALLSLSILHICRTAPSLNLQQTKRWKG